MNKLEYIPGDLVTAINIIIKKKNQLRKHKEGYISYINIDEVLVWLNDIQKELED